MFLIKLSANSNISLELDVYPTISDYRVGIWIANLRLFLIYSFGKFIGKNHKNYTQHEILQISMSI